jgi:hypothetical protein
MGFCRIIQFRYRSGNHETVTMTVGDDLMANRAIFRTT